MAMKKIQKMFYLSSDYVKKFIETRIEDLAIKNQRSSSFIIESILLDGLLPKNESAKGIIRGYLYPDNEQGGVQRTLDAIFSQNAAGINWKSKHNNFKPLVEFCIYFSTSEPMKKGNESHIPYLLSQFNSVIERIENCKDACIETYDRQMYTSQLELAIILKKSIEENPSKVDFRNCFQLVYDCWDMLDDWSITYRFLYALTTVCEFQENTISRNELYDIISKISEEW